MKTIALFSVYFLPHIGGIERYQYYLAKHLYNDVKIIIVTTKYDNNLKDVEDFEYGKIYRLPIYSIFSKRYPIIKKNKLYRKLMKMIKNENIDLCILNTRFQLTSLIGAKFAKKNGIANFLIEHGTSHFTVYNKVLDFLGHIYEHLLTDYIKRYVKDFYGVSKACSNWLKHYNIKSKGVLRNAIEISEYETFKAIKDYEKKKISILFAGRLLKDKGILLLIESYEKIISKYNNIELLIAGEGPLYEEIEKHKEIILLGKLNHDELMKKYAETDIFINPSYSEGMPTTILEAGLMKCAVIATNVGGTPEIIEDRKDGLLCKTEVSDITLKLEELINDENLRNYLSENLHRKVKENFSWEKTANDILKII